MAKFSPRTFSLFPCMYTSDIKIPLVFNYVKIMCYHCSTPPLPCNLCVGSQVTETLPAPSPQVMYSSLEVIMSIGQEGNGKIPPNLDITR